MGFMLRQLSKTDKHAHVSVKKGLKINGEKALNALLSVFGQIKGHDTFDPQMASKLTHKDKKGVLSLITMIKEKRYGKIKA